MQSHERPPRLRDVRFLGTVIVGAALTLIAAWAAKMMLTSAGDFSTGSTLHSATSHTSRPAIRERELAPKTRSRTSSTTAAVPASPPANPEPSQRLSPSSTTALAPPSARVSAPSRTATTGEAPRVGVTRNPMSFHPTITARP